MTVTAWIMLAFYVVVLGGGSVALVTYSTSNLRKSKECRSIGEFYYE